jgi:hypothetical protein
MSDGTRVTSQPTDDYTFFYGNEYVNHHLGAGFFVHKGIISQATGCRI